MLSLKKDGKRTTLISTLPCEKRVVPHGGHLKANKEVVRGRTPKGTEKELWGRGQEIQFSEQK